VRRRVSKAAVVGALWILAQIWPQLTVAVPAFAEASATRPRRRHVDHEARQAATAPFLGFGRRQERPRVLGE